jgi:hypothetical protein
MLVVGICYGFHGHKYAMARGERRESPCGEGGDKADAACSSSAAVPPGGSREAVR